MTLAMAIYQQDFSPRTLIAITVAIVLAALGWLILRFVLKLAWRAFLLGCVGILIVGAVIAGAVLMIGN